MQTGAFLDGEERILELKERNNKDSVVVRFNNGLMAAINEQYCINPACDCTGVVLQFDEVSESGEFKEMLFSLTLDISTWEVSKIKMGNANVDYERLVQEFVISLDTSLKERFTTLLKKAKQTGKGEVLNWYDDLNDEDGSCFGYSEVYGESENKSFSFDYKDRKYFVDDQYCTRPKCECKEVVLSFINLIPDRHKQEAQFVLRVPLGAGDYAIEYSTNIDENEIKQIFTRYIEHIHDMGFMKKRYMRMKEFGRKRIIRQRQKQDMPKIESAMIGRNDPCPCGSGKIYKKCCG